MEDVCCREEVQTLCTKPQYLIPRKIRRHKARHCKVYYSPAEDQTTQNTPLCYSYVEDQTTQNTPLYYSHVEDRTTQSTALCLCLQKIRRHKARRYVCVYRKSDDTKHGVVFVSTEDQEPAGITELLQLSHLRGPKRWL